MGELVEALLQSVVNDNLVSDKKLTVDSRLLLEEGSIVDLSGRTFKTSALKLALYYCDSPALKWMVESVSDPLTKDAMRRQWAEFKKNGLTYQWQGREYQEKHYNFSTLIETLQEYAKNSLRWTEDQRTTFLKKIAFLQAQLPMHAVKEYCDRTPTIAPEYELINNKENFNTAPELSWFTNSLQRIAIVRGSWPYPFCWTGKINSLSKIIQDHLASKSGNSEEKCLLKDIARLVETDSLRMMRLFQNREREAALLQLQVNDTDWLKGKEFIPPIITSETVKTGKDPLCAGILFFSPYSPKDPQLSTCNNNNCNW